jgi:hypothetical protein
MAVSPKESQSIGNYVFPTNLILDDVMFDVGRTWVRIPSPPPRAHHSLILVKGFGGY